MAGLRVRRLGRADARAAGPARQRSAESATAQWPVVVAVMTELAFRVAEQEDDPATTEEHCRHRPANPGAGVLEGSRYTVPRLRGRLSVARLTRETD